MQPTDQISSFEEKTEAALLNGFELEKVTAHSKSE
jgi:hypothetical protein